MFLKNLMLIVSLFTGSESKNKNEIETKAFLLIKKMLRKEILYISFNILIGLILASITIFSFIQMGYAFQDYLSHYVNGNIIEIFSFASVIIASLVALYIILRKESNLEKSKQVSQQIDLQAVSLNFIDGFIKGLSSKNDLNNK